MQHYSDDVAKGYGYRKLRIAGRPAQGQEETIVLVEEPSDPVLMHFRQTLVPHFKSNCPHCLPTDEPKPFFYIGGIMGAEFVIAELTWKCFDSASAAARHLAAKGKSVDLFGQAINQALFTGLLVKIRRADFPRSPRVLRCEQRATLSAEWPYRTREELARIWRVPIRPRLYREGGA